MALVNGRRISVALWRVGERGDLKLFAMKSFLPHENPNDCIFFQGGGGGRGNVVFQVEDLVTVEEGGGGEDEDYFINSEIGVRVWHGQSWGAMLQYLRRSAGQAKYDDRHIIISAIFGCRVEQCQKLYIDHYFTLHQQYWAKYHPKKIFFVT